MTKTEYNCEKCGEPASRMINGLTDEVITILCETHMRQWKRRNGLIASDRHMEGSNASGE